MEVTGGTRVDLRLLCAAEAMFLVCLRDTDSHISLGAVDDFGKIYPDKVEAEHLRGMEQRQAKREGYEPFFRGYTFTNVSRKVNMLG